MTSIEGKENGALENQQEDTRNGPEKQKSTITAHTGDNNVVLAARRDFLLNEIPLLNDLSQILLEVVEALPDITVKAPVVGRLIKYTLGDFELVSIDRTKTGIRFGDSSSSDKNKFQIIAKFVDVCMTANTTKFGDSFGIVNVPLISVTTEIAFIEIGIDISLEPHNQIVYRLVPENGVTVPSIQIKATRARAVKTIDEGVRAVSRTADRGLHLTDDMLHKIVDKVDPLLEQFFVEGLTSAIQQQSSNIVPDGMDNLTIETGEGTISSSITFNDLALDSDHLSLKAQCQWRAHIDGKPEYTPASNIHSERTITVSQKMLPTTDVSVFVDTALVDQMIAVLWYVTPYARVLACKQIPLGTALATMLHHFPHWRTKTKDDDFVIHLTHVTTSEPPAIKSSDSGELRVKVKVTSALSTHPNAAQEAEAEQESSSSATTPSQTTTATMIDMNDIVSRKSSTGTDGPSTSVLRVQAEGLSKIEKPKYNSANSTFDFHIVDFTLTSIVFSDYLNSHCSEWMTKFFDEALIHRNDKTTTFSHWWQTKGSLNEKCQSAMRAFNTYLMDCLYDKFNEAINEGLAEMNSAIDENMSQFALPSGEFNVMGHTIHLEAQEIVPNMNENVIKVMADMSFDDRTQAQTK